VFAFIVPAIAIGSVLALVLVAAFLLDVVRRRP